MLGSNYQQACVEAMHNFVAFPPLLEAGETRLAQPASPRLRCIQWLAFADAVPEVFGAHMAFLYFGIFFCQGMAGGAAAGCQGASVCLPLP